jgi:hypothetical protein
MVTGSRWSAPAQRDEEPVSSGSAVSHPLVRDLLRKGPLNNLLLERLTDIDGQNAALTLLFREISLETLNQCLTGVSDQELATFLLDSILLTTAVLSSEAFFSIEQRQTALRALQAALPDDIALARRLYDREVEELSRSVFALSRRLLEVEQGLNDCPFSGSSDTLRGLYGQRARDLAGSLGFLRADLGRWVRRSVLLGKELPQGGEARAFLEARLRSVVDDLGLRLREIRENLGSAIFDQLATCEPGLTRKQVFKRDLENVVELDSFLERLGELLRLVERYDQNRAPELLAELKTQLSDFRPERFPALSGIRESDQQVLASAAERIQAQDPSEPSSAEDPAQLLLLLLGDLFRNLKQRQMQDAWLVASTD